jgi:hypothetical protein
MHDPGRDRTSLNLGKSFTVDRYKPAINIFASFSKFITEDMTFQEYMVPLSMVAAFGNDK